MRHKIAKDIVLWLITVVILLVIFGMTTIFDADFGPKPKERSGAVASTLMLETR